MGCPPDPVDVSIWRSSERIEQLEERYNRFIDEYAEAALLAGQMALRFEDQRPNHRKEKFICRTDVQPDQYNMYADEAAQHKLEAGYRARVKELEIALCELRTRILCAVRDSGRPVAEGQLTRLRAAHASHREEDRQQAIAWLERQCEILVFYTNAKNAKKARIAAGECDRRLSLARTEITRLQAIPSEELLYDRSLTALDEEKFEIPLRTL